MRKAVLTLVLLLGAARAHATSGTCTISSCTNINPSLGSDFSLPVANGLAMPVEFDEAAGTFAMKRDAWSTQFGSHYCNETTSQACTVDTDCAPPACPSCDVNEVCASGAEFDTIGGVHGFILMDPGTVTGTIDAAGNVTLPTFSFTFLTDYERPLRPLPVMPTLATGLRQTTAGPTSYTTEGVALDFATGDLTLTGTDTLFFAPGSNTASVTGLRMTCRLSPVPTQAALPTAPTVKPRGKAKSGSSETGDSLTLKARLAPGSAGGTLDATQDFFIRLTAGGSDVVLLLVPANKFTVKGKKLMAVEVSPAGDPGSDGTIIQALVGHKKGAQGAAPFGGKIILKTGKHAAKLLASLAGLDLSGLTGTGSVEIVAGSQYALAPITITTKGSRRTFH